MSFSSPPKKPEQEMTAMEIKELGNKHFHARKYDKAIMCYTKAIAKSPHVPTYYSNRALGHLKLKKWELACNDSRQAIEMDSASVKSHFFCGLGLMELENYDDAIRYFQRANDLSKEQRLDFGDDIASELRVAKKKRWMIQEEVRVQQEIELQSYLNQLINEDKLRREASFNETGMPDAEEYSKTVEKLDKHQDELNKMFLQLDSRRIKRDVPDYLCGKISFDIMKEPVITPSGITYDRKDIEEHLQRVGHFDPVTRTPLVQEQLIPNLALKEVVDTFMLENEWAADY